VEYDGLEKEYEAWLVRGSDERPGGPWRARARAGAQQTFPRWRLARLGGSWVPLWGPVCLFRSEQPPARPARNALLGACAPRCASVYVYVFRAAPLAWDLREEA